jgi:predicted transcriptional regulator
MAAKKLTNITIRIPVDTLAAAQEISKVRDESISQVVRRALREYVEEQQKGKDNGAQL